MGEARVAFHVKERDTQVEPTREYLECYTIFDMKIDFTRKARHVANGVKTQDLLTSTYVGVVSKDTVRIAFTHTALHGLDLYMAEMKNAYLQAPITNKILDKMWPRVWSQIGGKCSLHSESFIWNQMHWQGLQKPSP